MMKKLLTLGMFSLFFFGFATSCASNPDTPLPPEPEPVYPTYYTVNFDLSGGTIDERFNLHQTIKEGDKIENFNIEPRLDGSHFFLGWYDENDQIFDHRQPIYDHYNLHAKYDRHWLYFKALENGSTINYDIGGNSEADKEELEKETKIQYSYGNSWEDLPADGITLEKDEGVYIMNANENRRCSLGENAYVHFVFGEDDKFEVSGNIMSMLGNEEGRKIYPYCFTHLFDGCTQIVSAPSLLTEDRQQKLDLAEGCYSYMFNGCTNLVDGPDYLLATNIPVKAYRAMFQNCSSLKKAPVMDIKNLEGDITIYDPGYNCYEMFRGCTSLTEAPIKLEAEKLTNSCYFGMFRDTTITEVPYLFHRILAASCFEDMFYKCKNLVSVKKNLLPITKLEQSCYYAMFYDCTSLTEAPELPALSIPSGAYQYMFDNCDSLTEAPDLPATELSSYCYNRMFYSCDNLSKVPDLPATDVPSNAYMSMFAYCDALTTAPFIAATKVHYCSFDGMFDDCENLVNVQEELFPTELDINCYQNMFSDCSSLMTAPYLPARTLAEGCYAGMFSNCKKLNSVCVNFTSWKTNDGKEGTTGWMKGVTKTGGTFTCPEELPVEFGDNRIPGDPRSYDQWVVNRF